MSVFGGAVTNTTRGDKGLTLPLLETFRQTWADPDLRSRVLFVFGIFGVFVLGACIPVPIPGVDPIKLQQMMQNNAFFAFLNVFGGGSLRRLSIFALGLNPYITASIIIQVLTTAFPAWKKELEEGGEYARKQQNKKTRSLTLFLCVLQSWTFLSMMWSAGAVKPIPWVTATVILFWTAGAMFMLWLGEQISEKGIGNGVSLMIFAGIVLSMPFQVSQVYQDVRNGATTIYAALALAAIFLATTWVIVLFTTAQRRIPIQHMRRQVGTRIVGGQTSYLPVPVNTAGVIPIIFAISLVFIPNQIATMLGSRFPAMQTAWQNFSQWFFPNYSFPQGLVGSLIYIFLIFFFTYFYTAIQYNVEDISNNLKRGGYFIPGVRPGKQTKEFLDGVVSRVTVAGAAFLSVIALVQYIAPTAVGMHRTNLNIIGGTSLLIMVQVALETMRQIEAHLLMKQYGS